MIVFISDLHIGDRTTSVQYLEIGAFAEALPNIARQANNAGSEEVIFVFLGDIFDMVRTTFWTVPSKQSDFWKQYDETKNPETLIAPWDVDVNNEVLEDAALFLLRERIVARNKRLFDLWSQELVGRRYTRDEKGHIHLADVGAKDGELIWPRAQEPRRVYIPGNHDRLVNQFPKLRAAVTNILGLNVGATKEEHIPEDGSADFSYYYHNANYRVFSRHGQEWDTFNFEHCHRWDNPAYTPTKQDYLDIPIGELIANEFSRLPTEVANILKRNFDSGTAGWEWATEDQCKRIVGQLHVLDDVRPMAAVIPWLFDSLNTNPVLRPNAAGLLEVLLEVLDETATRLEELPYIQNWLIQHNQLLKFDESDGVRLVLNSLQMLRTVETGSKLIGLNLYARLRRISQIVAGKTQTQTGSNYEQEALADLARVRAQSEFSDTLYILYGHTHHADQVPLTVPDVPLDDQQITPPACAVYLNTGTWRPLARQALNQNGFMRWKNLTFTIFYNGKIDPLSEAAGSSPTFETWTGSLLAPLK